MQEVVQEAGLRSFPPHRAAVAGSVATLLLATVILLAVNGKLMAASPQPLAQGEPTPTAAHQSLLPIVVGPAPVATQAPPPTAPPPTAPPPTAAPPTAPPPTAAPPTVVPPTVVPPTVAPPTVTPPTVAPPTVVPPTVAPPLQAEAQALYTTLYLPALSESAASTADVSRCTPGTISLARLAALEMQINYFRQMAGVPPIALDGTLNARAQAAALIMAAQGDLSHDPPESWSCYSEEGYDGASHSNLGISTGYDNRTTVVNFMRDAGSNNVAVGHRQWLLAPPTKHMGAGEVQGSKWDAYALYVVSAMEGPSYLARHA